MKLRQRRLLPRKLYANVGNALHEIISAFSVLIVSLWILKNSKLDAIKIVCFFMKRFVNNQSQFSINFYRESIQTLSQLIETCNANKLLIQVLLKAAVKLFTPLFNSIILKAFNPNFFSQNQVSQVYFYKKG